MRCARVVTLVLRTRELNDEREGGAAHLATMKKRPSERDKSLRHTVQAVSSILQSSTRISFSRASDVIVFRKTLVGGLELSELSRENSGGLDVGDEKNRGEI
ncbi:uncharacterized protein LOC143187221 [Calliopsis andreniformis]|uniref:uncharacterized protein LOC143187221 n=1 Tax=Calliopsis andreniformis TaxID=337506 RepID=UPI003FCC566A